MQIIYVITNWQLHWHKPVSLIVQKPFKTQRIDTTLLSELFSTSTPTSMPNPDKLELQFLVQFHGQHKVSIMIHMRPRTESPHLAKMAK